MDQHTPQTENPVDPLPPAPPRFAETPLTSYGDPSWVAWDSAEAFVNGMPRRFLKERPLTEDEGRNVAEALRRFIPRTQVTRRVREMVETKKGTRYKYRGRLERAQLADVHGVNYRLATAQGVPMAPEDVFLSVTLVDGRNYKISVEGEPLKSCAFCRRAYSPIVSGPRGDFHEACRTAELESMRSEKQSEEDLLWARSRAS